MVYFIPASSTDEGFAGDPGASQRVRLESEPRDELLSFFFSEFEAWRPILQSLRIDPRAVFNLAGQATVNGTDFQSELLASGLVSERDLFCAIASALGVRFLEEIDPERLIMKREDQALFLCSRSKHLHVGRGERRQDTSRHCAVRHEPSRIEGHAATQPGIDAGALHHFAGSVAASHS